MNRVPLIDRNATSVERKQTLDAIHAAFGATPAMFRAVANSPAALNSMWGSFAALGGGAIGARLGEQIAVAIANRNACNYCLAAHTALGMKAGMSAEVMAAAQAGESSEPKTRAAQAHRGEIHRHLKRDVDVVGEQIERDMGEDFNNLLVIESGLAHVFDSGGIDLAALFDQLEGELQRRAGLRLR